MAEKEQHVALAIEERELQKMAALSQHDSERDGIQQRLENLQQVTFFFKY